MKFIQALIMTCLCLCNGCGGHPEPVWQLLVDPTYDSAHVDAVIRSARKLEAAACHSFEWDITWGYAERRHYGFIELRNSTPNDTQYLGWTTSLGLGLKQIDVPDNVKEASFESVVLHELGHGVELDHVSDPNAVMFWRDNNSQTEFTDADLAEIKRVWGCSQK